MMKNTFADSRESRLRKAVIVVIILVAFQIAGCVGIGPPTVARDRFDYVSAISESWKRQTLLNLLKTRYADAPVFMDVTSVINQYALEGQVQLGATWAESPLGDSQNVGGSGKYTDRPTITYSPITGEKFTKSLMTPIPVPGILFLLQSGYPADYVMRITVHTINGIENRYGGSVARRSADPRFYKLINALRRIQDAGGLGMRVKPMGEKKAMIMFFRPVTDETIASDRKKAMQILGLNPEAREFKVVYGSFAADDTEIAVLSRSMLQIMIDFSSYIDVPQSDVAEGRVYASQQESEETESEFPQLIRVRNGAAGPGDAYVSVRYRDHWFWIDDRDYPSKRMFTFLMLLFSLTETGGPQAAPIVTVPTN
jgi:hypothetical protein